MNFRSYFKIKLSLISAVYPEQSRRNKPPIWPRIRRACRMSGLLFSCIMLVIADSKAYDHNMVVIVPSYNNQAFYLKNLDRLFAQDYSNFRVIYVDDCSSDKTAELVEHYIADHNLYNKMLLVKNPVRCGALRNIYMAIHRYCNDDDIVVIYDGDDWLANDKALSLVNRIYQDTDVWTTYGNFSSTRHGLCDWCKPFESHVVKNRSYRKSAWRFGPLRTFYAWLFKQIELKDLLHEGKFYQMAWDQSFVHPILEMADGRFKFIHDILYIYNEHNPINDWNVNGSLQHRLRDTILAKPPYKALVQKPDLSIQEPTICTVYVSSDNPDQTRHAFYNTINNPGVTVLWKSCEQNTKAYQQLIQEYPQHRFIELEKNLTTLYTNLTRMHLDMCLFIDIAYAETIPNNIQEHALLLQKTHAALATYAFYDTTLQQTQELHHTSYLWNTMFTFQLGWKPELQHPYKEFAWLIPMKLCKKNTSYIYELLTRRSSYQPVLKTNVQKAGLFIITEH